MRIFREKAPKTWSYFLAFYFILVFAYLCLKLYYINAENWSGSIPSMLNVIVFFGIWLQFKGRRIVIDSENEVLAIKPLFNMFVQSYKLQSVNGVEIIRNKKGVIKYLNVRVGKYQKVRLYVREPHQFIDNLSTVCDPFNVKDSQKNVPV